MNHHSGPFPQIARGHTQKCESACLKAKKGEAHFTDKGAYVDGHHQDQATAERAHQLGIR